MSLEVSVNLNSLRMIREEITSSISQSATDFEAFLADQQDQRHLEECQQKIAQVGGTFRLLQFPGAALLADEMAELIKVIGDPERKTTGAMIDALTHCYFVLPRYIEYVATKQKALPTLVIPYVNELRVSRKEALLPEYHFYPGEIPAMGLLSASSEPCQANLLISNIARLRHMYQAGLVGVIKDPANELHFRLMHRAISRVLALVGNHPNAEIWTLAETILDCFAFGKLELTLNRKRNLAEIERLLRAVVQNGEQGLNQAAPESLKKDCLFMLMLAKHASAQVAAVREAYTLPELTINDGDVAAQRAAMHGPSLETMESVIKVLNEEIRNAKDILEIGSQNSSIEDEDLLSLKDVVQRVADTLTVLNLEGPRATLLEQLVVFDGWIERSADISGTDFLHAADALLYVESALSGLDRRELSVDELNEASALTRKKVIASSQLAQAEQVVIEEAQAGIALVKRAITSYVDSNFDSAHIANVAVTLTTVRGGLHILNYTRAAAVLKSCSEFVISHIKESGPGNQRHQLLETLADALISLEYYLNEVETSRYVNEKILEVAEESLTALGFAVDNSSAAQSK